MEQRKRPLLETFKYLSAQEILQISTVSHLWCDLCSSDEIWLLLLGESDNALRLAQVPLISLQSAYRQYHVKEVFYFRQLHLYRLNAATGWNCQVSLSANWMHVSGFSIVKISGTELFLVSAHRTAIANTATAEVRQLPAMPEAKLYCGLILYDKSVYCLCGRFNDGPVRNCCVFPLQTGRWSALPDSLEPRQSFTPVLYRETVLLPNGCNATVESFSPATTQFRLLPISTGLKDSSSSLIQGDEILIFGLQKCLVWNLRTFELVKEANYERISVAISQFPPFVHRNKAYLVYLGVVRVLSLDTFEWVKSAK